MLNDAKEYNNTSFYLAYDVEDTTQYALVMPSVKKVYTHEAGDTSTLNSIENNFDSFPVYDNGTLCFSGLKANAVGLQGASVMANNCYDIVYFYIQKEKVENNTSFMLYNKSKNKVEEGLAGQASSFKVVKEGTSIQNENSISKEDYSFFTFDVEKAIATIQIKQDK